jgi:heat-inducible transcriptional repressor
LEEMGYVTAPHASSGRIPSDKGYRLYVDQVMKKRRLSDKEKILLQDTLKEALRQELGRMETRMREIARAVSYITNYTTIATEALARRHKIKHLQIIPVDGPMVALVLVTDLNMVKNRVITLPAPINYSLASKISVALTNILSDSSAADLTGLYSAMVRHRFKELGLSETLAAPLIEATLGALLSADTAQIHTIGMKNILDFPEFADLEKARAIVGVLEEKEDLLGLLEGICDEIQITIGQENENTTLHDCSIIKARVCISDNFYGNIAIIGPTRMNYAQVMSVLQAALSNI